MAGRSGIREVTTFDTSDYAVHIAGEVRDFEPRDYGIDSKEARRLDRFVLLALAASREALEQADLPSAAVPAERVGCLVGTGIGGITSTEHQMGVLQTRGPSRVSPLLVPSGTPDAAATQISLQVGFKGPAYSVCTACSSGSDSIVSAVRCLLDGSADVMVTGGAEAPISQLALSTFANLGALSTADGDPTRVCRPFDRDRSGFVLGEGAGILVIETRDHAERRGVEILGVLAGYGQTSDAFHKTAPDPEGAGAARAMSLALERARISAEEIGYVNAHGTSTLQNDPVETSAIKMALGKHASRVPVSSTKSMTGHLIGAGGAVEAIIVLEAIRRGCIPPTINYENPDPQCDLDYVPNEPRDADLRVVLSNSLGFGGHNASLVFCAADYQRSPPR